MKVKFHLPNFVDVYDAALNCNLINMMKEIPDLFYDEASVGSVFDSFPVIWNGGRIMAGYMNEQIIDMIVPKILKAFNSQGVPCRFTFTNPLLEKEHLDDYCGNKILDLADNGLNEVIVVSPLLEEHIRKTHPDMKLISSTCKQLRTLDALSAELEKDYKAVVLDYNCNGDYALLEKLPHKEKCELLVNAVCQPNCPRRAEHYRFIGDYQLTHCNQQQAELIRTGKAAVPEWKCPFMRNTAFSRRNSPTHISPNDIYNNYAPMGFENFKIEGRGNNYIDLAEQYVYYFAKPQYRDLVRYNLLVSVASAAGSGRRG